MSIPPPPPPLSAHHTTRPRPFFPRLAIQRVEVLAGGSALARSALTTLKTGQM